jgi:hypothetical protein
MTAVRKRGVGLSVAVAAMLVVLIGASVDGNAPPVNDEITAQEQATSVSPYRWQRTVLVKASETQRAVQFAVAVTEYVNQTYPEINVEVYMETMGDYGKIHWFVDYESLEQMQRIFDATAADTTYNQMIVEVAGAFVDGKTHDTVYSNMR